MISESLAPLTIDIAGSTGNITVHFAFDLASDVQKGMHASLSAMTLFEPSTTKLLLSVLKPGDSFIDAGAHIGYFSMLAAARVGPEGEVIAFEPSPSNFTQLLENMRRNGFRHVLPFHLALGEAEQVTVLHANSDNDGGHALWDVRLHSDNYRSRATPRMIPTCVARLDHVLCGRPLRSLKAIKLDVEGSEVSALRGAVRTLAEHEVPFVVAEVNRFGLEQMGSSEADLREFMTRLGYETWILQDTQPELVRLESASDTVQGNFVFNLLFRRPEAVLD